MIKWFIDDERMPPDDGSEWVILRSSYDAIQKLIGSGMPNFISFDHDLGGDDTSMVFIDYLIEETLNGYVCWPGPGEFKFTVHSQNPVGAHNIKMKLGNFTSLIMLENCYVL